MGWLRLVGSLKLQVSFAEYRLFNRALLQKRPIISRSLRIVATPYGVLTCVTRLNRTDQRTFIRSYVRQVAFICAARLIDVGTTAHPYMRYWFFTCVPCSIHMCDLTQSYMTWLNDTDGRISTQSHVRHDECVCAPLLIHMSRHFAFTCAPWRIRMRDMTPSYRRQNIDACTCAPWSIYMCKMTHSSVRHLIQVCVIARFTCTPWCTSHVWHGSIIETATLWLADMCTIFDMCTISHAYVCRCTFHSVTLAWFICVTWLNHTNGSCMTHWYVHQVSCICAPLHISRVHHAVLRMCDMARSYRQQHHDSLICAPWLIHMRVIAHFTCAPWRASHVRHDSSYRRQSHDSSICAPWLIHMCAIAHIYLCTMAWFARVTWLNHTGEHFLKRGYTTL